MANLIWVIPETKTINFPMALMSAVSQPEPQTCKQPQVQVTSCVWLMCASKHSTCRTLLFALPFLSLTLCNFPQKQLTFQVFLFFFILQLLLTYFVILGREGIPSPLVDTMAKTCGLLPRGKASKTNA